MKDKVKIVPNIFLPQTSKIDLVASLTLVESAVFFLQLKNVRITISLNNQDISLHCIAIILNSIKMCLFSFPYNWQCHD